MMQAQVCLYSRDWLNLDCGFQLVPASWAGWRTAQARGWRYLCWQLADQDFEDTFLAETQARLVRVMLRGHDHVASIPSTI